MLSEINKVKITVVDSAVLDGTATTEDVLDGKTFYSTNVKQVGTLALTGDVMSDDVLSGKTFYNTDAKSKQTGTLLLTGDATAEDVVSGKTFYNTDAKTKIIGTHVEEDSKVHVHIRTSNDGTTSITETYDVNSRDLRNIVIFYHSYNTVLQIYTVKGTTETNVLDIDTTSSRSLVQDTLELDGTDITSFKIISQMGRAILVSAHDAVIIVENGVL